MRELLKSILSEVTEETYWLSYPVDNDEALPDQFILFTTRERDTLFADNVANEAEITVYVDFYSLTDDDEKCGQLKQLMRRNGFALFDEMPFTDNGYYHTSTSWNYVGID